MSLHEIAINLDPDLICKVVLWPVIVSHVEHTEKVDILRDCFDPHPLRHSNAATFKARVGGKRFNPPFLVEIIPMTQSLKMLFQKP
jgi:hypothetical protein